ncbi:hypothetical protein VNI00_009957 [Paramarasmius palmivorus]|uniref:Uncharacterized protein n=1 Tax=Paramarasmius palmivorus TaxID=297713 RepID=A0AAW0CKM3_9AGAR
MSQAPTTAVDPSISENSSTDLLHLAQSTSAPSTVPHSDGSGSYGSSSLHGSPNITDIGNGDSHGQPQGFDYVCAENELRIGNRILSGKELRDFKKFLLLQMQAQVITALVGQPENESVQAKQESADQKVVEDTNESLLASSDGLSPAPLDEEGIDETPQLTEEQAAIIRERPELLDVFTDIALMRALISSTEECGDEDEEGSNNDTQPISEQTQTTEQSSCAETTMSAGSHPEEASSPTNDGEGSHDTSPHNMFQSQVLFESFVSKYLEDQFGQASKRLMSDVFDLQPLQFAGPGRSRTAMVTTGMYFDDDEHDSGVELDDEIYIRHQTSQDTSVGGVAQQLGEVQI